MLQPAELPPDPLIGQTLVGRYQILRRLGEGGMGVVYEAVQTAVGKRVAVKCLLPEYAHRPQVVARFQNEARAAAMIGNAHVVDVLDSGRSPDGSAFLVMEFLQGRELGALLEEGPLPIGRAVRIVAQLCEALAAVHARGIIHRDLKPANVFLVQLGDQPDFVKVLDFGISKFQSMPDAVAPQVQLTRTNSILGTPTFMSPEQFGNSRSVTPASDIYSLGAIFFCCLAGRPPFDAEDFGPLMMQVISGPAPDIRAFRPEVPEPLAAVISAMLATAPAHRFQDCAALLPRLAPFAGLEGPMAPPFAASPSFPSSPAVGAQHGGVRTVLGGPASLPAQTLAEPLIVAPSPPSTAAGRSAGAKAALALALLALVVSVSLGVRHLTAATRGGASSSSHVAPVPPTPPVPRPTTATFSFTGLRPGARVRIGGVPFDAAVATIPIASAPVRVRVEANGYVPLEFTVVPDRDQNVALPPMWPLRAAETPPSATPIAPPTVRPYHPHEPRETQPPAVHPHIGDLHDPWSQ